MNYENRIVLFLDILNFKNLVDETIGKEGVDNEDAINQLHEALSDLRNDLMINIDANKSHHSRRVTQFSDCLVVSIGEGDAALYPRVIFDKSILSLINDEVDTSVLAQYKTDTDDKMYLDYFAGVRYLYKGEK